VRRFFLTLDGFELGGTFPLRASNPLLSIALYTMQAEDTTSSIPWGRRGKLAIVSALKSPLAGRRMSSPFSGSAVPLSLVTESLSQEDCSARETASLGYLLDAVGVVK